MVYKTSGRATALIGGPHNSIYAETGMTVPPPAKPVQPRPCCALEPTRACACVRAPDAAPGSPLARTQMAHHPHHPGRQAKATTAAEYEHKLGKDSKGHPLPKQARAAHGKVCARQLEAFLL